MIEPFFVQANGVKLCVEDRGDKDAPVIILIMGLGAQMLLWPEQFVEALVAAGYRVIRFDNRDIGQSQKITSHRHFNNLMLILRYKLGKKSNATYTLYDMADDVDALMQQLNIKDAHIIGASMGGMIAQIFSAKYPNKVKTLTAIMTSTNHPKTPQPKLSLTLKLLKPTKKNASPQSILARQFEMFKLIESPEYPMQPDEMKKLLSVIAKRDPDTKGYHRQLQAIMATGDLSPLHKSITAPTLIIHGSNDPLIPPKAGSILAASIPQAKLQLIQGMGHDLPKPLIPQIVNSITTHLS